MYSEKVMDHFNNPRNVGEIDNPSGVGTVGNAKCGDIMRMYLDIDDNGVIQEAKFKTFGCGAAVATSSMATELVKGKTVQEALKVTNKAVMEALDGLPQVKVHCSLLAEEAIHAALWDYAEKHNIEIEGLEKPVTDIGEKEEAVEEEYQFAREILNYMIKIAGGHAGCLPCVAVFTFLQAFSHSNIKSDIYRNKNVKKVEQNKITVRIGVVLLVLTALYALAYRKSEMTASDEIL